MLCLSAMPTTRPVFPERSISINLLSLPGAVCKAARLRRRAAARKPLQQLLFFHCLNHFPFFGETADELSLENTTSPSTRTSKMPPDDGISVTPANSWALYPVTSSSATPAARGAYPHGPQNSICTSSLSAERRVPPFSTIHLFFPILPICFRHRRAGGQERRRQDGRRHRRDGIRRRMS